MFEGVAGGPADKSADDLPRRGRIAVRTAVQNGVLNHAIGGCHACMLRQRPVQKLPADAAQLNQLIRFMKTHGMPLNNLLTGGTRIMIVDDEQDIVEVLEKILEDEAKYEVEVAKGGFAAGVTAERFRPHVILLDVHLSDVDARDVVKQVKSSPDLQLTKVIAMSGKLTSEEAKGLMSHGFDSFLRKPFHVRQVIEAIEDAMAVIY